MDCQVAIVGHFVEGQRGRHRGCWQGQLGGRRLHEHRYRNEQDSGHASLHCNPAREVAQFWLAGDGVFRLLYGAIVEEGQREDGGDSHQFDEKNLPIGGTEEVVDPR